MGETQTLLLQIAADTSGFVALEKRFLDLTTTLEGAAGRINRSLGAGSKSSAAGLAEMQSKLEQSNAALRTQGAEIEALTAKLERQSSRRKQSLKDIDDQDAHVKKHTAVVTQALEKEEEAAALKAKMDELRFVRQKEISAGWRSMIAANNAEALKLIEQDVAAYGRAEKEKTAQTIAASRDRAITQQATLRDRLAKAEEASALETKMDELRYARQREISAGWRGMVAANNAEILKLIEQDVAAYGRAEKAKTAEVLAGVRDRAVIEQASLKNRLASLRASDIKAASVSNAAAATAEAAALKKTKDAMAEAAEKAAHLRDETRGLHDATRGLAGGLGALWMTYGQLIPLMAGFAISASIAAAVKTGVEFQYQMGFVAAVSESTAEKVAAAGESFKKLSLESMFSAGEIAKGARTMVQAGFSLEDAVKSLPQILKFATVGEIELGQAVEIAAGNMHAFGLTIRDLPHILDSTAKAAAISQTNIHEMGQALRQASTVAQQYGVSIDEMNAFLAVLAERNIRGSAAGTALRNMFIELDPHTEKARKAYKELGINVYDANNNFRSSIPLLREFAAKFQEFDEASRNRLANSMFNERGSKAFLTAIAEGGSKLEELFKTISKAEGFLDEASKKINKTIRVEGLEALHAFQKAFIDAFDAGSGSLSDFLKSLKAGFESDSFKNLAKGLVDTFFGLVKAIDACLPLLENLAKSAIFVGGAALVFKAATGFQALRAAIIATGEASVLAAAASTTAITTVEAGAAGAKARVLGSLGKAGLLGLILFGFMEIGGLLNQWQWFSDRVSELVDSTMAKIKGTPPPNAVLGGISWSGAGRKKFSDATPVNPWGGSNSSTGKIGRDWYGSEDYNMSDLKPEDYRKAPLRTWTPPDTSGVKAKLAEDIAAWKAQIAEEKALFGERHAALSTYYKEGLLTEQQFYTQSNALMSEHLAAAQSGHDLEVDGIKKAMRAKGLSVGELAQMNKQITAADLEFAKESSQIRKLRLADAAAITGPMLAYGKKEIEQSAQAVDKLKQEVEELKVFNPIKRSQTEREMEYAIAKEQSNLAKLEGIALGFKENEFLNKEEADILNAIAAMKLQTKTLQENLGAYRKYAAEKVQLDNDWVTGSMKGLEEYVQGVASVASQSKKMFGDMFKSLENSLTNFIMTGKLDFKDMLKSWAADIVRFVVQQQITKPLANLLGSMLQGTVGGGSLLGSVAALASGGSSGGASAAGTAGGLLSGANSAYSLYASNFGTGVSSAFTGAGTAYPNAAAELASTTTAGQAGSTFGSYASAAAPYLAALAAVVVTVQQFKKWGNDTIGKVGVLGGAAAGAYAGAWAGPIGMAVGAALGAIFGGSAFGRGPVEQQAGGISGAISGSSFSGQNWQDFKQDGGWFRSDKNWTETAAMTSEQSAGFDTIMKGFTSVLTEIGALLGKDSAKLLEGFTAEFKITTKDRTAEEIQKDIDTFFDKVFRDQLGLVLKDTSDDLMKYVDKFKGTTTELIEFAAALASIAVAMPTLSIKGLNFDSLDALATDGENVVQTFTRVVGIFNSANAVFQTAEEKITSARDSVKSYFDSISVAVPKNVGEFKKWLATIDLSTEEGRKMISTLGTIPQAFKDVDDAARAMFATIQDQVAQVYGGEWGAQFARQAFDAAANAWNAAGGWSTTAEQTLHDLQAGLNAQGLLDISNPDSSAYNPVLAALVGPLLTAFQTLQSALTAQTAATVDSTAGFQSAVNAANSMPNTGEARNGIADYLRGSSLNGNSPLTPLDRYHEARAQYERMLGLAQQNDMGALQGIGGARDAFLDASRLVNASSGQYNTDWFSSFDALNALTGNAVTRPVTAQDVEAQTTQMVTVLEAVAASQEETRAAVEALAGVVVDMANQGDIVLQGKAQEQIDALNKIANKGGSLTGGF